MKPYVIMSPDYNITSGGIKVMWSLYGWLLARGLEVYMNRRPEGEIIAIYPEIFHGNPAQANTIVRYILNKPGVMGSTINGVFTPGPTSFASSDKIFYFSRLFGKVVDTRQYLFLPAINLNTFKDTKEKRTKTCYLIGKGNNQLQHPHDSIELTREFARDQSALARLLNECTYLYCYDSLTAMTEVARLCGCRVRYFGDYTEDELELYEPGTLGMVYGNKSTSLDSDAFRSHYIELRETFEKNLDYFIEETQS